MEKPVAFQRKQEHFQNEYTEADRLRRNKVDVKLPLNASHVAIEQNTGLCYSAHMIFLVFAVCRWLIVRHYQIHLNRNDAKRVTDSVAYRVYLFFSLFFGRFGRLM